MAMLAPPPKAMMPPSFASMRENSARVTTGTIASKKDDNNDVKLEISGLEVKEALSRLVGRCRLPLLLLRPRA